MSAPIFQRPDLALALSNRLLHPDALQLTSRDGLFLTGVRRIGKTTFIRRDLIPQLEKEMELGRGRGISNLDKKARITRPAPLI